MKFASALSTQRDPALAINDLVAQVRSDLGPEKIDLALVYAHRDYLSADAELIATLRQALGARRLVGCSGAGIIGDRQECEEQPAISVLAAQLPGANVELFHITAADVEEAESKGLWQFLVDVAPESNPNFLVFLEPFSADAVGWVQAIGEAYPEATVIGGLSSGGRQAGECRLFLDDDVLDEGMVGVALSGNVELRAVVSQGCRPIGRPLTITRADRNVIFELAGEPPLKVLNEMLPKLPPSDQQLAKTAVFIGRVVNEYQEDFDRGDFLVRQLVGLDPKSGALAVGDLVRTGQTVQFQVRDGGTAAEDFDALLARDLGNHPDSPARAAVMFSCLGRGAGMYGSENHDISALQKMVGPIPAAGFFANGEIGPVGAKPFIHGFTSVIGLFAEPVR